MLFMTAYLIFSKGRKFSFLMSRLIRVRIGFLTEENLDRPGTLIESGAIFTKIKYYAVLCDIDINQSLKIFSLLVVTFFSFCRL